MHLLAYTDLFKYEKIRKKEINIFINNKNKKMFYKYLNLKILLILIGLLICFNSYYNSLKKHSNKSLIKKWELIQKEEDYPNKTRKDIIKL